MGRPFHDQVYRFFIRQIVDESLKRFVEPLRCFNSTSVFSPTAHIGEESHLQLSVCLKSRQ